MIFKITIRITMPQYKVCNCPRCHHQGISVGAMHYKETQQWHKSGEFSGSGVGIGTGGLGFGMGSGTYSESGEIATKRANEFSEPQPFSVPILHLILPLILALIAINSFPMMMEFMQSLGGDRVSQINTAPIEYFASIFNKYVAPFYCLFIVFMIFRKMKTAQEQEHHLNTVVYPKYLERYNEIRYCENCHTLYDHNNNAENANQLGMSKLMEISPGL